MEDFLAIPRYSYCKWLPWKPLFAYSLNEFRRVNIFDSRPMDPNEHLVPMKKSLGWGVLW